MSNSSSAFQSCTVVPLSIPTDAGIAGTGILIAFISTATIALLLSSFIVLSEIRSTKAIKAPRTIARKILSGLSDQQIISGIAIQSLALARFRTIAPYHFFIIWMLALLSTATNFAALLALVQDLKRDWVLRWLRQAAMFVNMCLTIVLGVLMLEVQMKKLPATLAVGCVWDSGFQDLSNNEKGNQTTGTNALSTIGTIAVIVASAVIFVLGTWYLHLRRQTWGGVIRVISLIVLWAIGIGATVRVAMVSQAFGNPSVQLADQGEKTWSFGQLLALILLVLPFISALEIYRGELSVPPCPVDSNGDVVDLDSVPLTQDGAGKRYTYQPTPWFKR